MELNWSVVASVALGAVVGHMAVWLVVTYLDRR